MNRIRGASVATGVLVLAGCLAGTGSAAAKTEQAGWTVKPVVSGLKQPRGIAFDRSGALYVAESGLPGPDLMGATQGAVDKYTVAGKSARLAWSTPFTSVYFNDPQNGSDVEGPEGLAPVPTGCRDGGDGDTRSAAARRAGGCQVLVILGNSQNGLVAGGGPSLPQIGHLYQVDGATGAATDRGNIGNQDFSWTGQHSSVFSDFPDANPYGVVATAGSRAHGPHPGSAAATYVIDAASNTVDAVAADGTARVIAYIPNETPTPNLPTRDATPTCAAQGPDGALYIGTLDLLRNFNPPQGFSHVYRVEPSANEDIFSAAHLWASGLTTITSCTFDSAGNFWAAEMFHGNADGSLGDVVRIPFRNPGDAEHIGGGRLPFPGGITSGPDGGIYVTTNSTGTSSAIGQVVRLSRDD